jgi:hypothetical protein
MTDRTPSHRGRVFLAVSVAFALSLVLGLVPALAAHPEVSLPGSNFEIDTDANLKTDDPAPSIDWDAVAETRKADNAIGSADTSFGQGSKEDTPVPSVVDGGIPPNKSDLRNFGVYLETTPTDEFLTLFWHRVQDPQGTTNMDFEFNKSDEISSNGVTPVRTSGDLLIQYDLATGGDSPELFLSRWIDGTETPPATAADCQAANKLPCWDERVNLTAAGDARGSINTSTIEGEDSDGLVPDDEDIDPRTFGEAHLDFDALGSGGDPCSSFGSAYLKSRSSDSFTAAMKDFIPPEELNFENCGAIQVTKTRKHEAAGGTGPHPGVTFTLSGNGITPVTATTDTNGVACFDGVALNAAAYTVTETLPSGYAADGALAQTKVVDQVGDCESGFETLSFSNTPLTNVQISIDSQVVGGTASTVSCTPDGPSGATTVGTGDGTFSDTNLLPQTITCTIEIDP